jgi:hypothetical protein
VKHLAFGETRWLREEESLRGRLLGPVDKEGTSYLILFPYSLDNVRTLRRGQMVAVRNFSSTAPSYTILEITTSRPVHYALEVSMSRLEEAYPGFLLEAAKSVAQDWEQDRPAEEVTRIRAEAAPTGLQIISSESGMEVIPDDSLPMQGQEAIPLTVSGTGKIVNYGLDEVISVDIGGLIVSPEVHVKLIPEKLVTTHGGIFGFTGAGKSNLLSTLTSELVRISAEGGPLSGLRIVLLDYMFEYFPLLADVFSEHRGAILLFLGPESIPGGDAAIDILLGRSGSPDALAQLLLSSMTVPDRFKRNEEVMTGLGKVLTEVIKQKRLKIYGEDNLQALCKSYLEGVLEEYPVARLGRAKDAFPVLIEEVTAGPLDAENLLRLAQEMETYAQKGRMPLRRGPPTVLGQHTVEHVEDISPTAKSCLQKMANKLRELASKAPRLLDIQRAGLLVSLNDIVNIINEQGAEASLILVISEDPDKLRQFFSDIVSRTYHYRRSHGQNRPLALFIVDEADEFLPREAEGTYAKSRDAAETLARRGRKFGLGLQIATQRVAYLDTKTMGQLHTYFVSKLPRKYDREAIAEAFGASLETIDKCLELRTGEWFVVSHSATGLKGVPVPIRAPNAEDRIEKFMREYCGRT